MQPTIGSRDAADVPEHAAARGVLGGSFSAHRSRVAGQGRDAMALG
jgi:hypothetical protein